MKYKTSFVFSRSFHLIWGARIDPPKCSTARLVSGQHGMGCLMPKEFKADKDHVCAGGPEAARAAQAFELEF